MQTFYLQRNFNKPYHVDYCFAPQQIADRLKSVMVGVFEDWIQVSDHVPMIFDIDIIL